MQYTLLQEQDTLALGSNLARVLKSGMVVYLQGDLGTGKTTLVRSILGQLGQKMPIKSPTYTLVESYYLEKWTIHHFDLYRLHSPQEWGDMGLNDLFTCNALCFIEWPEKAATFLPTADWQILLSWMQQGRNVSITASSFLGQSCLKLLTN